MKKWYLAILGGAYIASSLLGVSIAYIIKGKFNFGVFLWSLIGSLILIIINVAMVFLKRYASHYYGSKNTKEYDSL